MAVLLMFEKAPAGGVNQLQIPSTIVAVDLSEYVVDESSRVYDSGSGSVKSESWKVSRIAEVRIGSQMAFDKSRMSLKTTRPSAW